MLETARDQTNPTIKQLSFFLPNRVGALLAVVRKLEEERVHLCAINILDSADHAVVRMVVDRPSLAIRALQAEGLQVFETDLIGIELAAASKGSLRGILSAILLAEVNVHYCYSLMLQAEQLPVVALHVDDRNTSVKVLRNHGFTLIGQDDLHWES